MTYIVPQRIHNKRKRLHRPKRGTRTRQEREKLLLQLNSKRWGPHSEPDSRPRYHQTATSLLLLPLLEVLTYAHINKVDDHRKGANHTQSYKQTKGKLMQKGSYII